ncbi:MAG: sulfurtransferase [Planctomycetes bacterium]|nr:sulfurtransferase [Planctomycetota bacterium]
MQRPARVFLVWIAVFALAGCDKSEATARAAAAASAHDAARGSPAGGRLPAVLVDAGWVQEHFRDPALVLIDARTPEEYAAGHIAGAVNVSVALILDPTPDHSRHIAPLAKVQKVFSGAGLGMSDAALVYDEGVDYRESARLFYVLEAHGHQSVGVMNGGYRAWVERQGATSREQTSRKPTQFVANMQPERMATKLTVSRALQDPKTIIIDARSDAEYRGEKSDAPRAGHIPGAINIDAKLTLLRGADSCQFKYSSDLLNVYGALPQDRKIITYCNTGTRASISYLALRQLGRDVAVYDGAWMEWAGDPVLPIESAVLANPMDAPARSPRP